MRDRTKIGLEYQKTPSFVPLRRSERDSGPGEGNETGEHEWAVEPAQSRIMNNIPFSSLPTAIQQQVMKQLIFAGMILIIAIGMTLWDAHPVYLVGIFIAGVIAYRGIALQHDYAAGRITELTLLCVSNTHLPGKRGERLIFRTDDDIPKYFEFRLAPNATAILPNNVYLVYLNPDQPRHLIAFMEI